MSDIRWAIKYKDGNLSHQLFSSKEYAENWIVGPTFSDCTVVPVITVEVESEKAKQDDKPWPPKWGEGAPCGYCRRKATGLVYAWYRDTDGDFAVVRDKNVRMTVRQFAADYGPV